MRVLHLPTNIASQISVTVRALREIGVDARGLTVADRLCTAPIGVESYPRLSRRRHPIAGTMQTVRWWRAAKEALQWADVVHYHYYYSALPFDWDLRWLAKKNKPRIVEFWGSDIRIPEIAAADNPYFRRLMESGGLRDESRAASIRRQTRFARRGFACVASRGELSAHVDRKLFTRCFDTAQRIVIDDYPLHLPDPANRRPLVIHSPTFPAGKGTPAVLAAVEQLKGRFDFEFRLVHGLSHAEAIGIMRQCDIMLDQFITGDHGLAAIEAMATGKPTLCYIKPAVAAMRPDCPIVNANPDNLTEVLACYLADGALRREVGEKSRAYAERHHDARVVARQLLGIYETLLAGPT